MTTETDTTITAGLSFGAILQTVLTALVGLVLAMGGWQFKVVHGSIEKLNENIGNLNVSIEVLKTEISHTEDIRRDVEHLKERLDGHLLDPSVHHARLTTIESRLDRLENP